ncbi:hypothetical protein GALL_489310 [mine drainage metagenome]|uniref:Uncharacterized protein n=1 Tax=mine drainage metagenome TaxID=410659 RepID=A0A1J5PPF8_9ZZZZ
MASASARSRTVSYFPDSSMSRQRCARTRAFTRVLSTRAGVGIQGEEPAGVTTCLRPPWWRSVIGITTAFPCDQTVEIRAEVSFLERQGKIEQCNEKVEAEVRVVGWPSDYLGSLDAGVVWEHADDAVQLHLAICLETANVHGISLNELPLKGVPPFCIGSEFLPSLRSHGALSKGTLANVVRVKCSQVLFSKGQAKPKSFKETRSGDEAEAFRVHLSKDHEAFRLMYWARPDGSTEFANIGVKQELSICKGDFRIHAAARYC